MTIPKRVRKEANTLIALAELVDHLYGQMNTSGTYCLERETALRHFSIHLNKRLFAKGSNIIVLPDYLSVFNSDPFVITLSGIRQDCPLLGYTREEAATASCVKRREIQRKLVKYPNGVFFWRDMICRSARIGPWRHSPETMDIFTSERLFLEIYRWEVVMKISEHTSCVIKSRVLDLIGEIP